MPWFDRPDPESSKWRDMSFDYKIAMTWMLVIFASIIANQAGVLKGIEPYVYFGLFPILLCGLLSLIVRNRRANNWHWPGLTTQGLGLAALTIILGGVFLFVLFGRSFWPGSSPPIAIFAVSILALNLLWALNAIQFSREQFDAACSPDGQASGVKTGPIEKVEEAIDPPWKRAVRGAWYTLFLLAWLVGMGAFYYAGHLQEVGSAMPTATQTVVFADKGQRVYITPDQSALEEALKSGMMIGIPAALLSGFFIHFVLGVYLFQNMPRVRGIFGGRNND